MRMRSSGVPMFLGIYSVCLLLVACMFIIKNDATPLRRTTMVFPKLQFHPKPKVTDHWVLMNPIKKSAPAELDRPASTPNVMIAVLPMFSEQEMTEIASSVGAGMSHGSTLLADDNRLAFLPKPIVKLVSASESAPEYRRFSSDRSSHFQNAGFRLPIAWPEKSEEILYVPGNIRVSNDYDRKQRILVELEWLEAIGIDNNLIVEITDEISYISEISEWDSGEAEAAMYRILTMLNSLPLTDSDLEAVRIHNEVTERISNEIRDWIEILNHTEESIQTYSREELDSLQLQKINMAVLLAPLVRMF